MLSIFRFAIALFALMAVTVGAAQAGTYLSVSDEPAPADATFLTYSVNSFARPIARVLALNEAARRHASGGGPHILLSTFLGDGGVDEAGADQLLDAEGVYQTKNERAKRLLTRGGVPEEAIEVLPPVSSEFEEGLVLRQATAGRGWRRIVVYAPDFRARRTAGTLRRAMVDTGVEIRVVAVHDPRIRLERWWETHESISAVLNEYPRLIYYALLGRL